MAPRILLVDDDAAARSAIAAGLRRLEHEVSEAGSIADARLRLRAPADLVLLDYRLPDGSGFELLDELVALDPELPIIMLTAHSSVSHAATAMTAGAFHYTPKPVDLDELARVIGRALETTRLRRELRGLRAERWRPTEASLIGDSPAMRSVRDQVARIAATPGSPVLISGESGTGKDLVARALHGRSDRASGPFLGVSCSALAPDRLERELFGHRRRPGLIEQAAGGTTFIDDIGEIDFDLQVRLLRLLESGRFRRVGGDAPLCADTWIVAATDVELREAVKRRAFREDLYYRLAVLTISLPPLREREDDAEALAGYFVQRFNRELGKSVSSIADDALMLIRSYPWPGNVRELKNAVERAVLLSPRETLTRADFEVLSTRASGDGIFRLPAGGIVMRELELDLVRQALERTRGNRTRAARLLGMNRDQIRYRIDQFGLEGK